MSTLNSLTSAGLALIEKFEGLRLTAYLDPAGVWTIGYGHTPSYKGQVVDLSHAEALLRADLVTAEMAVTKAILFGAGTNDNQFSAMVSLAFNIGGGAFKGSTLLKRHRAGQFALAAAEFTNWDKAHVDGKLVVLPGLLSRRLAEMMLYNS